jgi:hypothetical protein
MDFVVTRRMEIKGITFSSVKADEPLLLQRLP